MLQGERRAEAPHQPLPAQLFPRKTPSLQRRGESAREKEHRARGREAPEAVHKGRQGPPARTGPGGARTERPKVTCALDAEEG